MAKLFSESGSDAVILEKGVAVPASISIQTAVQETNEFDDIIPFSCFITKFEAVRKSLYQAKRSLDHQTHIIPFGEAPTYLEIRGVTFGTAQLENHHPEPQAIVQEPVEPEPVYSPEIEELFEEGRLMATEGSLPTEDADSGGIVWPSYDDMAGTPGDLHLESWTEASLSSEVGDHIELNPLRPHDKNKLDLTTVVRIRPSVVDYLFGLEHQVVHGSIEGLTSAVETQKLLSPQATLGNSKLSFPELNLLFNRLHVGATARAQANTTIRLMHLGVVYTCVITKISFQSRDLENVIDFQMTLLCLKKIDILKKPITDKSMRASRITTQRELNTPASLSSEVGEFVG